MARHLVLERRNRLAQSPLRVAHGERQARELSTCTCGILTAAHFSGPHCSGKFLGCAGAREPRTDQGVTELGHEVGSVAPFTSGEKPLSLGSIGDGR